MAFSAPLRWFVLAAMLAAPAPALCQPARHAQAQEQFKQGREAQVRGDYRRALELFQASQAIEPGRGKLVNIAICEKELKLLGSALRHFEQVLPELHGDDRLPIVEKHLAEIRPRVPMLRIDLAPGTPEARIKLDDEAVPAAKLAGEIPVDPGKHTITIVAEGRAEARREVEIKEREHRTLRVEAGAPLVASGPTVAPPVAISEPDRPAPNNGRRTAGFALTGVGAAALVVGAGTGIVSILDHGSAVSGCPTHVGCSQSVLDKASQGKALAIASTAAFAAGAALAGVGVYLVISGSADKPKASTGIVVLPGGARLEGRF
jgi:hypothetical protein